MAHRHLGLGGRRAGLSIRRRRDARRKVTEYATRKGVYEACELRSQCTRAKRGRSIMRHDKQELIELARRQARSPEGRPDRRRRRPLMEGSFAQAANHHHFKRSRWRRLWRQQIQDWLIAAIQNLNIFIKAPLPGPKSNLKGAFRHVEMHFSRLPAISWKKSLQQCARQDAAGENGQLTKTPESRIDDRQFGGIKALWATAL